MIEPKNSNDSNQYNNSITNLALNHPFSPFFQSVTVKNFHIYKYSMERTLRLLRFLFSSLTQGLLLFEPEKRGSEQRNQLSYEMVFFLVGGE